MPAGPSSYMAALNVDANWFSAKFYRKLTEQGALVTPQHSWKRRASRPRMGCQWYYSLCTCCYFAGGGGHLPHAWSNCPVVHTHQKKKHWRIGPIRNMIGPSGTNCTFNWLNGVLDGSNWASKDFFRLSTAAFDTSDQYRQDTGTSKAPPLSRSLYSKLGLTL